MATKIKLLGFISLVLFVNACSKKDSTPSNTSTTQVDIAAVDSKITSFMSTYDIPGASLAVSKNGKLVYIKGYGVTEKDGAEAVTTNSRFRLASLSKTYTGVAIMKLIQAGTIHIDDKVFGTGGILGNDYGTPPYSANLSNITVRNLLQHTSGGWSENSGGDPIDSNPTYNNDNFFNWVIDTRPVANTPGTLYGYSNMGYFTLGRIIEKATGQNYIDYIKSMMNALGATSTDIAGKTEAGRKTNEVKYYGQGADVPFVYDISFPRRDADGGLITTASDVLRLITAVDGFSTRQDILDASTLTIFTTPSTLDTYACGIDIWSAEHVWYNYGSLPGTRTGYMRGDNGMCVSLLFNSRQETNSSFIYAQQDLLLDIINNGSYPWLNIDQF